MPEWRVLSDVDCPECLLVALDGACGGRVVSRQMARSAVVRHYRNCIGTTSGRARCNVTAT